MIKPSKLQKGDTIAIIAPSWNGYEIFPHVVELGIKRLEAFGFKVKKGKSLMRSNEELYTNPKLRADDIHEQFEDENVKGIISIIGGYESVRVLPHIDPKIITSNPKFFMGFSDITTFNAYFNQLGLVTFNGPAVMAGFAESYELQDEFIKYIESFLFDEWEEFSYQPFSKYSESYLDWNEPKNLELKNPNYIENTTKWRCIQGKGCVEGKLFGGCIEVFEFMKGTKYWPGLEFFDNKILFFETSEDKPSPDQVEHFLRNYGMMGILESINGILVGRAKSYSLNEKKELEEKILKVLKEFNREDLIVITNVDFGHTDPQVIFPLGIKTRINSSPPTITLLESIWK